MVEDLDHFAPGRVKMVLHHRLRLVDDPGDFLHLKPVHIFEQQGELLFEREGLGNAGKTERDMLFDLKFALRGGFADLERFLEEFRVVQGRFPAQVGHIFRPALPGSQQVPGLVGGDAEHPGLEG